MVLLLQKWVKSHGYRPGQALMLWKCLYGDNIWAHSSEELEGCICFALYYSLPTHFTFCFFYHKTFRSEILCALISIFVSLPMHLGWNSNFKVFCLMYLFTTFSFFVIVIRVGLNKNFKNMLGECAELKVVHLKEILTASDGTRKVDIIFLNCLIASHFRGYYYLTWPCVVEFFENILIDHKLAGGYRFCSHWKMDWLLKL